MRLGLKELSWIIKIVRLGMNLPKCSGIGPDRLFEFIKSDSRPVRASDMLTGMGPVRLLFQKLK